MGCWTTAGKNNEGCGFALVLLSLETGLVCDGSWGGEFTSSATVILRVVSALSNNDGVLAEGVRSWTAIAFNLCMHSMSKHLLTSITLLFQYASNSSTYAVGNRISTFPRAVSVVSVLSSMTMEAMSQTKTLRHHPQDPRARIPASPIPSQHDEEETFSLSRKHFPHPCRRPTQAFFLTPQF